MPTPGSLAWERQLAIFTELVEEQMTTTESTLVGQMAGFCEVKGPAERCKCVGAHGCVCMCSYTWRSEVNLRCHFSGISTFATGSFAGLELCPSVFACPAQGV